MTISNLYMKYAFVTGGTNLPIVVMLQGWGGQASDFSYATLNRMASSGFFVAAIGMRGRDGASGARVASGREIYDIYDGIQHIRTTFAANVNADKVMVVGASGGGGNALGCACKFPDTFATVVDMYGMSDYGRDPVDGWWAQNPSYRADIELAVGGLLAVVPNNYYSRDATVGITNYTAGKLVIFHDDQDSTVNVSHSVNIKAAMDGAGLTNYSYNITTTTDGTRWLHGHAWEGGTEYAMEQIYVPLFQAASVWTVPASGTVTVIGYIVTKRFTVWLNSGLTDAATVAYNTATDTYTVTPLTTAPINVTITQGAKTGSATGITGTTQIVVA